VIKFIAKDDVKKYPLIKFKGNIHVIDNQVKLSQASKILRTANVLGFDTETKPSFKKGVSYKISLLQLSSLNDVFIFRLNKIGLDKKLTSFLSNPDVLKVGIDVKNDIIGLKQYVPFKESNFLDLNKLALDTGFQSIGAVKLSIMLLGKRISKTQRLSDWSSEILTDKQLLYAATDAWICPKILDVFKKRGLYC